MSRLVRWIQVIVLIALVGSSFSARAAHAQESSRFFSETGQTVKGRFLEYWNANGGVMQQGFPISGELEEKSATDGKTYTVQYFERAVFEKHPENAKPFDVLLSLLGVQRYNAKYPNGAPAQRANDEAGSVLFPETGKRVGGSFLVYFNQYGGVPQQGLPISDEFQERSDLDGKIRVVQYFERAVMEWNPDNKPPFNVLLAQLGTFAYNAPTQPAPVLLEPYLPAAVDGKKQFTPIASDRYLAWLEGFTGGSFSQYSSGFDVRALDLTTNQVITVTDAPGNQDSISMDGSLIAWRSLQVGCDSAGCSVDGVFVRDLATGKTDQVKMTRADGTAAFLNYPTVAGRYVVSTVNMDGVHESVVAKNVDNGTQITVFTSAISAKDSTISGIAGSGRFLVWRETLQQKGSDESISPYAIYTYDFATGKLNKVLENSGNGEIQWHRATYSLDNGRLIVSDRAGNTVLMDLITGTQKEIPVDVNVNYLQLFGNRLLIATTENSDISGMDLTKPELGAVKLLGPAPETIYGPNLPSYRATLAGDWLVWTNSNSRSVLSKMKVDLTAAGDPTGGATTGLPQPARYRAQSVISVYGPEIIYWDCPLKSLPAGQAPCLLKGYDQNTLKDNPFVPSLTPEQAPEVVLAPGGLLVWRRVSPLDCTTCPTPGIYAVDLNNGKTYDVVTGLVSRYEVAAYGDQVAWIEQDESGQRVMRKNLNTGEIKVYREIKSSNVQVSHLRITTGYMVWAEQDTQNVTGAKSSIVVLNLGSGEMSTIFAYDWKSDTARYLLVSLDVSRVAVKYGMSFFVHNLVTNQKVFVGGQNVVTWMQLNDKILVYTTLPFDQGVNSTPFGTAIYALHIDEPEKVYTLLKYHPSGNESYAASTFLTTLYYSDVNAQQPKLRALRFPSELVNRGDGF